MRLLIILIFLVGCKASNYNLTSYYQTTDGLTLVQTDEAEIIMSDQLVTINGTPYLIDYSRSLYGSAYYYTPRNYFVYRKNSCLHYVDRKTHKILKTYVLSGK